MTRKEAIANLNMISAAFVDPVTKEQRKLINDTFDMAIQALSQEPCEDAISREDATKHIKDRLYETACNNTTYQCYADEVFADIAEHRIETWMNEIPSVT